MITIYSKNGSGKAVIKKFEYSGEFMGRKKITFSYDSPNPFLFEVDDYCTYRGNRFKIYEKPSVNKVSSNGSYGGSYTYTVILYHELRDLEECKFLDYVPSDNGIHYTNFTKGSFYGTVDSLAIRIQVNLERLYTGWTILVDPSYERKVLNVPVDNINCLEALNLSNTIFGTSYTVNGKTITIGAQPQEVAGLFKYKQGLINIDEANSNNKIITRLRAYGSTRNLPVGYNKGVGVYPESFYAPNLMLPHASDAGIDYIDSENKSIYGIREDSVFFDGSGGLEEIYPSIEGMTAEQLIAAGIPTVSTGALDEVVSATAVTSEDQPTVEVYIKDIGFDINDYLGDGAVLSIRTGMCVGSELDIVSVTKTDTGYKLVVRRADEGTFYIPNMTQNIAPGDKFVILGIQMPDVYVKAAEQRLKTAAIKYLAENDHEIKVYTPKFDDAYIDKNSIDLRDGMVLNIYDEDLGIYGGLIIQTINIKEDGELPSYDLTVSEKGIASLTDRMKSNESNLQATINNKLDISEKNLISYLLSSIRNYGGELYLSKLNDDTAKGLIKFLKGIEVGAFTEGALGGGGAFKMRNGISYLETDMLSVRMRATFREILVEELKHIGGQLVVSPANMICNKVEEYANFYRCYFDKGENDEKVNTFEVGDLARCQIFSGSRQKFYWRAVIAVGDDYIELSKTDCLQGSDAPEKGDNIVSLGNKTKASRQSAQILSAVGIDAPSFKQYGGINSFSLEGKELTVFTGIGNKIVGKTQFLPGSSGFYNIDEWPEIDDRISNSEKKNMTFFSKPEKYKKGDTWFLVEDTIVADILYQKGTFLHAVYETGTEYDWREVTYEDVTETTDGVNLIRNYDLRYGFSLWGNEGESGELGQDELDELPKDFYKKEINVMADEYGYNYAITSENEELIILGE